jgi:transmembrane sensor
MADDAPRRQLARGTPLETPLARHLWHELPEANARRMWQGIEARLRERERAPRPLRELLAVAAALLLVGSSAFASWRLGLWEPLGSGAQQAPGARQEVARALVLAEGGTFESVEGSPSAPRSVTLSDGSRVEASAGARVEALASTPTELALVVRRGQARFSVTPGGPRRWSIEARGVRVEVVGTVLSVATRERSVSVAVEVGAVVVRSPLLADGVTRLVAGQSLELPAAEAGPPATTPPSLAPPSRAIPGAPVAASPVAPAAPRPHTAPAPQRPIPPEPSARATTRARVAASPPEARHEAARRLWAEADAARAAGDVPRATELLERLLREHPDDPRASLAAYTLGTLLDAEPGRAARAFRQALDLGLPSVLSDTCHARLAAALYAAGDFAAVRAVAAEYRAARPHGEQRRTLDELDAAAAASLPAPAPASGIGD